MLGKPVEVGVEGLQDPNALVASVDDRHAENGAGYETRLFIHTQVEAGVIVRIIDDQGLAVLVNPAGNAGVVMDADFIFSHPGGHQRPQFLIFFISQKDGASFRTHDLVGLIDQVAGTLEHVLLPAKQGGGDTSYIQQNKQTGTHVYTQEAVWSTRK